MQSYRGSCVLSWSPSSCPLQQFGDYEWLGYILETLNFVHVWQTLYISSYRSRGFTQICEISLGNWVGSGSAWGTKARKRSHWQQEIESAIAFNFVLMYSALNIMLNWRVLSTSVLTNAMTAGDFDVCSLTVCTIAWLSMWNNILVLANKGPQTRMATTTGNSS